MSTIDRGEDYLYVDFIDNIIYILEENKIALGLNFIGAAKDFLASKFPSIYVIFDNAEERWVSMPNGIKVGITVILHYYHKNLNARVRKEEIDLELGKIAKILRQNHSCNGFLNTQEGMAIERIDAMGELRGEMGGIGDGIIEVTGTKKIRISNIK